MKNNVEIELERMGSEEEETHGSIDVAHRRIGSYYSSGASDGLISKSKLVADSTRRRRDERVQRLELERVWRPWLLGKLRYERRYLFFLPAKTNRSVVVEVSRVEVNLRQLAQPLQQLQE